MKIDARKLKALRQQQGWTQEELAEKANVHPRTVQRSESSSFASRRTTKAFADALGVELNELMISVQIPFGIAIILNAIIWSLVMILTAITFKDQPGVYDSIQNLLSSAAASSLLLFMWLIARYRKQSSTV